MLRIGDFARLGGVTVRALRHYEAEGLLAPAEVHPVTGYCSYRFDQLASLDRILAMRDLGFPLSDIRPLLSAEAGLGELLERVRRQKARLAAEVERQTTRLRRIGALERAVTAVGSSAEGSPAEIGVRVRPIADVRALTLRARVRSQGAPITALFEEAEARAARGRADQSPFLIFHGPHDVEACVPVRPAARAAGVRIVRGTPLAASITYSGSYAQTRSLHARMVRWLERSGLRAAGPLREVYHRFGADQRGYSLPARRLAAAPEQFVTELQVPAEEEG